MKTTEPSPTLAQQFFASRLWNGWSPGIFTIGVTLGIAALAGALIGLILDVSMPGPTPEWMFLLRLNANIFLMYLPIALHGLRRWLWAEGVLVFGALYLQGNKSLHVFDLSNGTTGSLVVIGLYVSLAVPLLAGRGWKRIGMGHIGLLAGLLGIAAGYGVAEEAKWTDSSRWFTASFMSVLGWGAFSLVDYLGARWFPPKAVESADTAPVSGLAPGASLPTAKGMLFSLRAVRGLTGVAFLIAAIVPTLLIVQRTRVLDEALSPGADARPPMKVMSISPWRARSVRLVAKSNLFVVLNEGERSAEPAPIAYARAYCNRLSEMEDRQPCYGADGGLLSPCDGYQVEEWSTTGTFWVVLTTAPANTPPPSPPPSSTPTPSLCPADMAYFPAGTFRMGSEKDDEAASNGERPAHDVTLTEPFCLDVAEVTVAKYRACTNETRNGVKCAPAPTTMQWGGFTADDVKLLNQFCNGDRSDRDEHPINCVDWNMADTYCKWAGGALPTEAQWEYAARGKEGRKYPWGNEPAPGSDLLNACGSECRELGKQNNRQWAVMYESNDGAPSTAPVRSYAKGKTPEGVFDLAGNVWEWVADVKASYTADPVTNPLEIKGNLRALRGGGWFSDDPRWVRAANRVGFDVGFRLDDVGFRCARGQNQ